MSVHPSVCPHLEGVPRPGLGGTLARSSCGGGGAYHCQDPTSGTPMRPGGGYPARGYPTLGTHPVRPGWEVPPPPSDLPGGTPARGTPPQVTPITPGQGVSLLGGYPHQTWMGYPCWGVPHLGYHPLSDLAGGVPHLGYPPSDLVRGYPC